MRREKQIKRILFNDDFENDPSVFIEFRDGTDAIVAPRDQVSQLDMLHLLSYKLAKVWHEEAQS